MGIDIDDGDIRYLVGSTSIDIHKDIVNKHFNECYIISKKVDLSKIKLQEEEVSEVRFFNIQEIMDMVHDGYKDITEKIGPWSFLERILNNYYK